MSQLKCCPSDNSKTIKSQIAKLDQLFATRDQEKVKKQTCIATILINHIKRECA